MHTTYFFQDFHAADVCIPRSRGPEKTTCYAVKQFADSGMSAQAKAMLAKARRARPLKSSVLSSPATAVSVVTVTDTLHSIGILLPTCGVRACLPTVDIRTGGSDQPPFGRPRYSIQRSRHAAGCSVLRSDFQKVQEKVAVHAFEALLFSVFLRTKSSGRLYPLVLGCNHKVV